MEKGNCKSAISKACSESLFFFPFHKTFKFIYIDVYNIVFSDLYLLIFNHYFLLLFINLSQTMIKSF